MKKLTKIFPALILLSAISLLPSPTNAWMGPSTTPPGGDTLAPINTSNNAQVKTGKLYTGTDASLSNPLLVVGIPSASLNSGPTAMFGGQIYADEICLGAVSPSTCWSTIPTVTEGGTVVVGSGTWRHLAKWNDDLDGLEDVDTLVEITNSNHSELKVGADALTASGAESAYSPLMYIRRNSVTDSGDASSYKSANLRVYGGNYVDTNPAPPDLNTSGNYYPFAVETPNGAALVVDPSGNVGIGNNIPSVKLAVQGNVKITAGGLDVSGTATTSRLCLDTDCRSIWPGASQWAGPVMPAGTQIYYNVTNGKVGIGNNNPAYPLDITGDARVTGQLYVSGAASTYGGLSVNGVKNSYSGINFRSGTTNYGTLMVHPDYQGFYNNTDNGWDWYWTNGTLSAGTIPAARISGYPNPANTGVYLNGGGTWTAPTANVTDGSITNAKISDTAAIVPTKLSLPTSNQTTQYLRGDGAWASLPGLSAITIPGDSTYPAVTLGRSGGTVYLRRDDTNSALWDIDISSTAATNRMRISRLAYINTTQNTEDGAINATGHGYGIVGSVQTVSGTVKTASGKLGQALSDGTLAGGYFTSANGPALYTGTGNVGIGIVPTAKLDIDGQIKIRGGTPGANKVLTSDDNGLATWALPASSQWTTSGSNIYYNSGNVGIGVSSPSKKLSVNGSVSLDAAGSQIYLNGYNSTEGEAGVQWSHHSGNGTAYLSAISLGGTDIHKNFNLSLGAVASDGNDSGTLYINTNQTNFSGNIGVGLPINSNEGFHSYTLGVNGTITAVHFVGDGSGLTGITPTIANGSITLPKLSTTGTASASTYLRGDGSWVEVASANLLGTELADDGATQALWPALTLAGGGPVYTFPYFVFAKSNKTLSTPNITLSGTAKATTFCIGTSCLTAWPGSGTASVVTGSSNGTGLSFTCPAGKVVTGINTSNSGTVTSVTCK